LAKELDMDTFDQVNDDYLKFCFYESLRIEPPLPISTSCCMTEDVSIGNFNVKAKDLMIININQLHHDEEQWGKDHNIYRPERFAERGNHHPMSFIPFLAGKRVCVGKTFAENSFKVVMPLILKAFKRFEFENPELMRSKPINNIAQ
jgi:cytochrome P450 family 6